LSSFDDFFDSDSMPHGAAISGPELVWLHVCSDAFIVLVYVIDTVLAYPTGPKTKGSELQLDVRDVRALHPGLWRDALHECLEYLALGLPAGWRAKGDSGFCVHPDCCSDVSPRAASRGAPKARKI
jgi:hypothetical protein